MINERNKKSAARRAAGLCGAALAITLVATNVNYYPVEVDASSVSVNGQATTVIPSSLTMSSPTALSSLALPASPFGTLSWASPGTVPSAYAGSYTVVLKVTNTQGADFSQVPGWNAAAGTVTGSVTVYVQSLAATATPAPTASPSTPAPTAAPATPAPTEVPSTPAPTEAPAAPTETPTASETPAVTETPTASETPAVTETPTVSEIPAATETPAESEAPGESEIPQDTAVPTVTPDEIEMIHDIYELSPSSADVDSAAGSIDEIELPADDMEAVGTSETTVTTGTYQIAGSNSLVGGEISDTAYGEEGGSTAASHSSSSSTSSGSSTTSSSTTTASATAVPQTSTASSSNSTAASNSSNNTVSMTTKRYGVLTGDSTDIGKYVVTGFSALVIAMLTAFTMIGRKRKTSKSLSGKDDRIEE